MDLMVAVDPYSRYLRSLDSRDKTGSGREVRSSIDQRTP